MQFLHLADIHLGKQQYNSSDRFDDFSHAFRRAMDLGIENRVDAIVIAGDLFDKATVEPLSYIQAAKTLSRARQAGIPVIAVEGNHDTYFRYRNQISWLDALAHEGYLVLLRPNWDSEQLLSPWDGESGGYIDIAGVRFAGLPWIGAATALRVPSLAQSLAMLPRDGIHSTVLLAHLGIEGVMPRVSGCLTYDQLQPLHDCVSYLALGHLHQPFESDHWAFNPGSLEVCDAQESRSKKGVYLIGIEGEGAFTARYIETSHRPFYSITFPVDSCDTPQELYRRLRDSLREHAWHWRQELLPPVVVLALVGTLSFDRSALDTQVIEQAIREEVDPLLARVTADNLSYPGEEIAVDNQLPHEQLERAVLREIAGRDSRYLPHAESWARAMVDLKELALRRSDPTVIATILQQHIDTIAREAGNAA